MALDQDILLVADDAATLTKFDESIRTLRAAGVPVRAAARRAPAALQESSGAETAAPELTEPVHQFKAEGPQPVRRAVASGLGAVGNLRRLAARDRWFTAAAQQATVILALDRRADGVLPFLERYQHLRLVTSADALDGLRELSVDALLEVAERSVQAALNQETTGPGRPSDGDPSDEAIAAAIALPDVQTALVAAAGWARLPTRADLALTTIFAAVNAGPGSEVVERLLAPIRADRAVEIELPYLRAWSAWSELTTTGETAQHPPTIAAALLDSAGQYLNTSTDEVPAALVNQVALALDLLFHRELHSDAPRGPLVSDPDGYLAPVRQTAVWQRLSTPSARPEASAGIGAPQPYGEGDPTRRAVVALPGATPRFATAVIEALRGAPDTGGAEVSDHDAHTHVEVSTLDLGELDPQFRFLTTWAEAIEQRLRVAAAMPPTWSAAGHLDPDTDVVFADWADKGALWASLVAPPTARLVVRAHSVDLLRPWLVLIDWGRVDTLILVAEHMRDLAEAILGPALDGVEVRVIPNIVPEPPEDGDPADHPRPAASAELTPLRTLVMTGWAQRVKDPLFALDILTALRRTDPAWRLILIGPDFGDPTAVSGTRYAEQFRERAMADEIRDAIEYTGYLDPVAPALRGVSHVLSTSVREGDPLSVIEGLRAGAVPVIRDWPQFAAVRAAARIYGDRWVIGTVEQAVALIQRTSAPEAHAAERVQVEAWLGRAADPATLGRAYREAVLGTPRS